MLCSNDIIMVFPLWVTGGESVVGAFDCVGGEVTRAVVAATNPGAQTLIYGALGGSTLQLNTLDIFLGKIIQVHCASRQGHKVARHATRYNAWGSFMLS